MFCSMQVSACSDTAQPFESAILKSSSHSDGRDAARVRSRKRTPSAVISKWRPTWRDTLIPPCGVAARRTRVRARDDARAWRK